MLKSFFADLYDRVFRSLWPTLIGLGLAVAVQVIEFATGWFTTNLGDKWYAAAISLVLGAVGAWLRTKKPPTP